MYTIGEFSRISGFSIKTLRYYHERGLLEPKYVDPDSGYRYYDAAAVERAAIIRELRNLEFPLNEIEEMLKQADEDASLLAFFEQHRNALQERIRSQRSIVKALDLIIQQERESQMANNPAASEVSEKKLPQITIAGVRMQGRYDECGKGFGKIGRSFGRYLNGKALCLIYDEEFKEDDADFEPCMPIKPETKKRVGGVEVRVLEACDCITLTHHGPYDELGKSYAKLMDYAKANQMIIQRPTREVYIKGPGMIFRGNPKKYITEIQLPVRKEQED